MEQTSTQISAERVQTMGWVQELARSQRAGTDDLRLEREVLDLFANTLQVIKRGVGDPQELAEEALHALKLLN